LVINFEQAISDPLVRARLGPGCEEFLRKLRKTAKDWRKENEMPVVDAPCILANEAPSNCNYVNPQLDTATAIANLLVASQTMETHHQCERNCRASITVSIHCSESGDGARTVGVQGEGNLSSIEINTKKIWKLVEEEQ
jgi:hypothetical protein